MSKMSARAALDLAEIERALEPFAEWACEYDRLREDAVLDVRVKAGALLRAAAALANVREVAESLEVERKAFVAEMLSKFYARSDHHYSGVQIRKWLEETATGGKL